MARVIAQAPLLARVGLLKVVSQYRDDIEKYYPQLVGQNFNTKQKYEEIQLEGDFAMAAETDETRAVNYDDFNTDLTKRFVVRMRTIGFQVSKQAKYTDLYGKVARPSKKLALAMNQTREQVVANVIINATATGSQYLGPDGVAFASTAHPIDSGTTSNRPSPDLAFSYPALAQAFQELGKTKSDRGNPCPITGPFLVFGSFDNQDIMDRTINSPDKADTANRSKNMAGKMVKDFHINPYFTFTNSWGVIDTTMNPIFTLDRIPLFTEEDYDQDHLVHKFVVGEEYTAGFLDWRGFWFTAP